MCFYNIRAKSVWCGGWDVSVAAEDDRSGTKLSRDPGASGGRRLSIFQAFNEEMPIRVSYLYRSGEGVYKTKRTRFFTQKNQIASIKSAKNSIFLRKF
mmetsp:Transcript_38575/g.75275  ORF Transcript_38575/g.75275 Transcript_38575/m.75275 type:complete len:98 (-) Transcript_38575:1331-1624(-)